MNYTRIVLASMAAFAAYFVLGGLTFTISSFREEFLKFPAVYRSREGQTSHMPPGMIATFLAMLVLAAIYAMLYRGGPGIVEGTRLGALIGVFFVCTFVVHNYVNLNIGLKLTLQQAVAYFVEWTIAGLVIGLTYRPSTPH